MFEKEARERVKRKIYNFIVSDLGVSQIITGQTCETVEGMPHFYQYSLEKMWQEGAEFGYNKFKEELNHKGLALQSDMDKTIEQNIALKKENAEMKEQLTKAKELLTKWAELFKPKGGNIPPTPIQVETEQFISEVEKCQRKLKLF